MGVTSLVYRNIKFDSDEEFYIACWLQELQDADIISKWRRSTKFIPLTDGLKFEYTKTTKLKTKVKTETKAKELLKPSHYTPDFEALFEAGWFLSSIYEHAKPDALFYTNEFPKAWFEVKPAFDQNNMTRTFKNNQKFIWDKHKIFVNLLEPVDLFKKTFMPRDCAEYFKYSKAPSSGKNKGKKVAGDWKVEWTPKTLTQYLESIY